MLECRMDGHPPPNISWARVEDEHFTELSTDQHSRVHYVMNGSLFFSPVLKEDQGVYHCIGQNRVARVAWQFALIVLIPRGRYVVMKELHCYTTIGQFLFYLACLTSIYLPWNLVIVILSQ